MIRDVVLHLMSEQPLLADLDALPNPVDSLIVCTNVRMMNGSRPIFVDDSASTFVFPMEFVRFVEIPPRSMAGYDRMGRPDADAAAVQTRPDASPARDHEAEADIDEDFLKRVRDV